MNFAALKTATLDRAGLPSSDGLAQDTSLGLAVNHAVQRIAAMRLWPWLYAEGEATTVADQQTLDLPAAAYKVKFVAIEDDVLDQRQRADLVRFSDVNAGRPNRWAPQDEDTIVLAPTPDQAYTVTVGYVGTEPTLALAGDTPLLPVQYHDLIVAMAARYLAIRRKDSELVTLLNDEVDAWLRDLNRNTTITNGPIPVRTRQDWSV